MDDRFGFSTSEKVTIDPEFDALIPKLTPEEYQRLEASIREHGCMDTLKVWSQGDRRILLDGHNRYRICEDLDEPYTTECVDFHLDPNNEDRREDALLWIEENQLARRNLTDDQRAVMSARVANRRIAMSKKERASTAGRGNGKANLGNDALPKSKPRIAQEVAKENKIPLRKLRAAQKLDKNAPDLAKKVLDGEMPLAKAARCFASGLPINDESVEDRKKLLGVFMSIGSLAEYLTKKIHVKDVHISVHLEEIEEFLKAAEVVDKHLAVLLPRLQSIINASRVAGKKAEAVTVN